MPHKANRAFPGRIASKADMEAKSPIGTRHVILLSQLLRRLEATWTVAHWNACYHNFDMYELSSLSLLNKPIVSAYLVSHPNWRQKPVDEPGAAKLTKATGPRLKIDQLRKDAAFTTISKWT